ncbi:MAG: hypothetical protein ABJC09_00360 [Terriglobia bacterium]
MFEAYCARSGGVLDSMEWSWKLQRDEALTNRVFWLGKGGHRDETSAHVEWLFAELGMGGRLPRNSVLTHHTDRALVSYAGPNPKTRRTAAIKVYLTLNGCDERLFADAIRPLHPDLPEQMPPGAVRPLICYAAYDDGEVASRAYFLYNAAEFDNPAVVDYFGVLAGPEAVRIARLHPSSGFAFKRDTTDMLGLSLRPTAIDSTDHEALWSSPALTPLLYAAGRNPLLREYLHRVSWVTVPLTAEALLFPCVMEEMNVYARL